jgi:hypothetical protein
MRRNLLTMRNWRDKKTDRCRDSVNSGSHASDGVVLGHEEK